MALGSSEWNSGSRMEEKGGVGPTWEFSASSAIDEMIDGRLGFGGMRKRKRDVFFWGKEEEELGFFFFLYAQ